MKNLQEYLLTLLEEEGGTTPTGGAALTGGAPVSTPANTIGMGNISPDTDPLMAAPAGGTPKEKTHISKRRKKKRKDLRDFIMTGVIHNT